MQLYKTRTGNVLHYNQEYFLIQGDWDRLIDEPDLYAHLHGLAIEGNDITEREATAMLKELLAPIGTQEVWAAGVTYLKSRDARIEESQDTGGADFYQKVYEAARPELFFKSLPHRVAAPGTEVYIRRDSSWNVPEPELTLYINSTGRIQAYTIGNDMSSRSIEGENPLYLPQAKMYERSAALGPCLYISKEELSLDTVIAMKIFRKDKVVFDDQTQLNRMKRKLKELSAYLFRAFEFSNGVFLMTGTCVAPPNDFTLKAGDRVEITIDNIGTLINVVAEYGGK